MSEAAQTVIGEEAAVSAGHPLTVGAAMSALKSGGNAIDAAVAAGFMACVAEPAMTGLGGHGRMAIYLAHEDRTIGIDHFIRAPAAATRERFDAIIASKDGDMQAAYDRGPLAVGVFGMVAGLCTAHERHGSLELAALLEPAIGAAEAGVAFDRHTCLAIQARKEQIATIPDAAALLLGESGGRAVTEIDTRDICRTLKAIAIEGAAAIHRGRVSELIESTLRRAGGVLTARDLRSYMPEIFEESRIPYRDHAFTTCGEPIGTETLNILEQFDLRRFGADSVAYRHCLAEAQAQAFIDGFAHLDGQGRAQPAAAALMRKDYAAHCAKAIDMARAKLSVQPGQPWDAGIVQPDLVPPRVRAFEGTTQICVADRNGNFVSLITSLGSAFGALICVPGTGIWLGNAMKWFAAVNGASNAVAPGRMPIYGAPVLIGYRQGRACGAVAGSGGYRIQSAVLSTFLSHVDHGIDLQAAVNAPRQYHEGQELEVDARVSDGMVAALKALGHRVKAIAYSSDTWPFGRASAVWRDTGGRLNAACDARAGAAAAY